MYGGTLTKEMLQARATRIANVLLYVNDGAQRCRLQSELSGIHRMLYGWR